MNINFWGIFLGWIEGDFWGVWQFDMFWPIPFRANMFLEKLQMKFLRISAGVLTRLGHGSCSRQTSINHHKTSIWGFFWYYHFLCWLQFILFGCLHLPAFACISCTVSKKNGYFVVPFAAFAILWADHGSEALSVRPLIRTIFFQKIRSKRWFWAWVQTYMKLPYVRGNNRKTI